MDTLIILALPDEAPDLKDHPNVFFTGVGKVNAAAKLAQLIERYKPKCIINFGTAGGVTVGTGFYKVSNFVQRDMNCTALGVPNGQTPFDELPIVLSLNIDGLTCSTGDNFVTNSALDIPADLVDMEAYALAKVCLMNQINFSCWKFVSDQADTNASTDWATMIASGQPHYIRTLQDLNLL